MTTLPSNRQRNWAVYLLAALAVIAGILALMDAARYMGWLPTTITTALGEYKFVVPNAFWFAAIMSGIVGVIWFIVANWIWSLNPSGWLFVVVMAILNLIMLVLALLGQTTFQAIMLPLLVNAGVLVLAFLPGTQAAFGRR